MATEVNQDGWIEWKGGECPVNRSTFVEVKFRDGWGEGPKKYKAGHLNDCWHNDGVGGDIIAYRVVEA